jgi:hypothetical protein
MYTEIEKEDEDEVEVRYNQITIPLASLESYLKQGWELVEEKELTAVIRKELR